MQVYQEFKKFKISKRNGTFRSIYAPLGEYRKFLKKHVFKLAVDVEKLEANLISELGFQDKFPNGFLHGFMHARNPVTNALCHKEASFILSIDLKNFFDSVEKNLVQEFLHQLKWLSPEDIDLFFIDGIARQGLPTSPALANLSFLKFDREIIDCISGLKEKHGFISYTRYADDLTFGFSNESIAETIEEIVRDAIEQSPFLINSKKTHLQSSKCGNLSVTGIAINPVTKQVIATRKIRRKIRAALHQCNSQSYNGLLEFSKCKVPTMSGFTCEIDKAHTYGIKHGLRIRKENILNLRRRFVREIKSGYSTSNYLTDFLDVDAFLPYYGGEWENFKRTISFIAFLDGAKLIKSDKGYTFAVSVELENGEKVIAILFGRSEIGELELLNRLKKDGYMDPCDAAKLFSGHFIRGEVKGSFSFELKHFKLTDGVIKERIKPRKKLCLI